MKKIKRFLSKQHKSFLNPFLQKPIIKQNSFLRDLHVEEANEIFIQKSRARICVKIVRQECFIAVFQINEHNKQNLVFFNLFFLPKLLTLRCLL